MFTNALLQKLGMNSVSIYDEAEVNYKGCDDKDEKISTVDLYAILGATRGYFEHFGFHRFNQAEIASLMSSIHKYPLDEMIMNLKDGTTVLFDNNMTLGQMMRFYWTDDKCVFSRLYRVFQTKRIFDSLNAQSNGYRVKMFEDNMELPDINIFHTT